MSRLESESRAALAQTEIPSAASPPIDPLLRMTAIRPLLGGVAASTIWRWVQAGNFPPPVRLGDNVIAWRTSEIAAWITSRQNEPAKPSQRRGGRTRARGVS